MYVPTTPSVESVVKDTQIKLPRFQRKKTWDKKRRFELCVSIFKGYPLGTIVVKSDYINGKEVKWLLDGRQRRDTFADMQDPFKIYEWASEYLGIKKSDEKSTIRSKFKTTIFDYLQNDEDESSTGEEIIDITDENGRESPSNTPVPFVPANEENTIATDDKINQLMELICTIHNKTNNKDNFTAPFYFKEYRPSYYEGSKINSSKLANWVGSKLSLLGDKEIDSIELTDITQWFDNPPPSLEEELCNKINEIKDSIKMVQTVKEVMSANIQVITLTQNCKMSDARKIFEIINTKGVALTGAEIMSAKPTWNEPIPTPNQDVVNSITILYNDLGISTNNYVKWDIAASFVNRLKESSDFILGSIRMPNATAKRKTEKMKSKEIEKKMTAGFKLMGGYYINSITKDDIDTLPTQLSLWDTSEFESEIERVSTIITSDDPFRTLMSYGWSMCDYLGFTTGLNYLLLMIKKWKELNKPTTKNSKDYKTFISNARTLFDTFVYEYATGVWKGSSDSRLSRNLKDDYNIVFRTIDDTAWDNLIDEVYNNNQINGQHATKSVLNALLIYFSMLRNKKMNESISLPAEVDHIIPQSKYCGDYDDDDFKDSLFNYSLLPKALNLAKSGNDFNQLTPGKRKEICSYEDIDEKDIENIKTPANKDKLIELRYHVVEEIKDRRKDFIHNKGEWVF